MVTSALPLVAMVMIAAFRLLRSVEVYFKAIKKGHSEGSGHPNDHNKKKTARLPEQPLLMYQVIQKPQVLNTNIIKNLINSTLFIFIYL